MDFYLNLLFIIHTDTQCPKRGVRFACVTLETIKIFWSFWFGNNQNNGESDFWNLRHTYFTLKDLGRSRPIASACPALSFIYSINYVITTYSQLWWMNLGSFGSHSFSEHTCPLSSIVKRDNTTKITQEIRLNTRTKQIKIKNRYLAMLHSIEDLKNTFQIAKGYDIMFKVIPYSYHSFGKKVLSNVPIFRFFFWNPPA